MCSYLHPGVCTVIEFLYGSKSKETEVMTVEQDMLYPSTCSELMNKEKNNIARSDSSCRIER